MSVKTAHIIEDKWRSDDIKTGEDVEFSSLFLHKNILTGLEAAGYKFPSPIQLKAIPVGKIGKDLIVQAKSGTGKTLVFTVIALNMLTKGAKHAQVLIMAPTREIACQIRQVIQTVGCFYKDFKSEYFIGGRRLEDDVSRIQGCQVIVGTPGRIKQLISYKLLKTAGIRLFVLDEADQLLKESSFTTDIDDIFRALPRDKQMIATSATYPDKLKKLIDKYFRDPLLIRLNMNDIGLLGMAHYYREIPVSNLPVVAYKQKLKLLENVLLSVKFAQCLVFCNMVSRVENLCVEIKKWGFATAYISSAREQEDRLKAIELLKRFKCKVLVSSDLSSRGIDAENVDLVINFDMPTYLDTYFHRVGRAGRFGSKCASITFITSDQVEVYQRMQRDGKFKSFSLPDPVPKALISIQPIKKPIVEEKKLSVDRSESSSDTEELNENGIAKQEKANGFIEKIKINVLKDSFNSTSSELNSENSENLSVEKLVDSEIASKDSGNSREFQNQLLDLNSNPTIEVKEDHELSNISKKIELDNTGFLELKQQKMDVEVCSAIEIVSAEKENDNSKVNENTVEESCNSDKLNAEVLDQESSAALLKDNMKSDEVEKLPNKIPGLEIVVKDTNLSATETVSEQSLKEKTIDEKLLVVNNEFNAPILNNPDSKELISSAVALIKDYGNDYKSSEECSIGDSTKSSPSINDDKLSSKSLECLRSDLSKFYSNVCKDFVESLQGNLIKEVGPGHGKEKNVNQVVEIGDKDCVQQEDNENQIQNSCQDSPQMLFSTPKTEATTISKSDSSSGHEHSGESGKEKLLKHFDPLIASIPKKPSSIKRSSSENSSSSNSSASINDENAMYMLTKKFNKVTIEKAGSENKEAGIITNTELTSCTDSDSGTSIDSDKADAVLEKELTKFIKNKGNGRCPSKNTDETKRILEKIKGKDKRFKGIQIVDTKTHDGSSSSDSDTSTDGEKTKEEPKKEIAKKIQTKRNEGAGECQKITHKKVRKLKAETVNGPGQNKITHYYSETSSSATEINVDESPSPKAENKICKKSSKLKSKTVNGPGENKITYYYSDTSSSETEIVVDQHSSLKTQNKIRKNSKLKSKTVIGPGQNKITHYYSATNSSETESDVDQHSKKSHSSPKVENQSKTHKWNNKLKAKTLNGPGQNKMKDPCSMSSSSETESIFGPCHSQRTHASLKAEPPRKTHKVEKTLPKAETLSNTVGAYLNSPHYNYQTQPNYASNSYDQQVQSHANQGLFPGYVSNPYYNQFSQPIHRQGPFSNGQSNHQMHVEGFNSNPYYSYSQQNGVHANHEQIFSAHATQGTGPYYQHYPSECSLKESCQMSNAQFSGIKHAVFPTAHNMNCQRVSNPSMNPVQSNFQIQPSHNGYNHCFAPSQHPCHPPNETCQSPICASWYNMFYQQWQFLNQCSHF